MHIFPAIFSCFKVGRGRTGEASCFRGELFADENNIAKQQSKQGWDVVDKNKMAKQYSKQGWEVLDRSKFAKQYSKQSWDVVEKKQNG